MEPEEILTAYLHALERGSYQDIVQLFEKNAVVHSPLYGKVKASLFYEELLKDTTKSAIRLLNLFTSKDKRVGAVHFLYEWELKTGATTSFECVDVIKISDDGKITDLTIIYDTFTVREGFDEMKKMTARLIINTGCRRLPG